MDLCQPEETRAAKAVHDTPLHHTDVFKIEILQDKPIPLTGSNFDETAHGMGKPFEKYFLPSHTGKHKDLLSNHVKKAT